MRTCPKCGWVFPSTYVRSRCEFCNTLFDVQICYECKELVPSYKFYWRSNGQLTRRCPDCNVQRSRKFDRERPELRQAIAERFRTKHKNNVEAEYNNWLEEIQKIKFTPMNEKEWLETCKYFDGCAICKDNYIEVRQFFVPFEEGGKYAVWNMIPLCGKCAAKLPKNMGNPFKRMNHIIGDKRKMGLSDERKDMIIDYLFSKVREAQSEG